MYAALNIEEGKGAQGAARGLTYDADGLGHGVRAMLAWNAAIECEGVVGGKLEGIRKAG